MQMLAYQFAREVCIEQAKFNELLCPFINKKEEIFTFKLVHKYWLLPVEYIERNEHIQELSSVLIQNVSFGVSHHQVVGTSPTRNLGHL